jgi:DNA-binding CsgD family transcriptional regulator
MDDDLHKLISEIYAIVGDGRRWTNVLDRFAWHIGAYGCIISEIDGIAGDRQIVTPYMSSNFDQDKINAYLKVYSDTEFKDQKRYEILSKAQDGVDLIREEELARGYEQEYFSRPSIKWLREAGVAERIGGLLDKDNLARARFSVHLKQPLTVEAHSSIRPLMQHIAKAIDLSRPVKQLEANQTRLMAGINRLRIGVAILDSFGRVELANDEFNRQVDAYSALSIDRERRLILSQDHDRQWLDQMVADVHKHGHFGARPRKEAITVGDDPDIANTAEIGALCIEIAPLERTDELGSRAFNGAVLYSLDTTQKVAFDPQLMAERYTLSKTESKLLGFVGQGLSNPEIAEARGVSVNTINAQVKALFSKTGTKNRTQVVRLMACYGNYYLL